MSEQEMNLVGGVVPKLFDIIKVHLQKKSPTFYQPENIVICNSQWRKVGVLDKFRIVSLIDSVPLLWSNDYALDRIPISWLRSQRIKTSLLLIKPSNFRLIREAAGKIRSAFIYKQIEYNLVVTDIDIRQEFESRQPGEYTFNDSEIFLCISLGEPFRGYTDNEECCYKLVASVIRI